MNKSACKHCRTLWTILGMLAIAGVLVAQDKKVFPVKGSVLGINSEMTVVIQVQSTSGAVIMSIPVDAKGVWSGKIPAGIYDLRPRVSAGPPAVILPGSSRIVVDRELSDISFQIVSAKGKISGRITGTLPAGMSIPILFTSGNNTQTVTVNSKSDFVSPLLPRGIWRIKPAAPAGHEILPAHWDVDISLHDVGKIEFGLRPIGAAPTWRIAGQVAGLVGTDEARIVVEKDRPYTTRTRSEGRFELADLPEGIYIVKPVNDNYRFAPAFRRVDIKDKSAVQINFLAVPVKK